jgi:hypothetical protein
MLATIASLIAMKSSCLTVSVARRNTIRPEAKIDGMLLRTPVMI